MRSLYALLFALPLSLQAQTIHQVQVGGSTAGGTPPFYNPQNLTINVGDIVRWTNTSGTHNVNGSTTLFPANPQSFSSGSPQGGNWTFEFTFTIAGVYNYHCTQQGHSATQFGNITVLNPTVVAEQAAASINLFPIPTADVLTLDLGDLKVDRAEILMLDGRVMASHGINGQAMVHLPTATLPAGNYILRLVAGNGTVMTRPFIKG
ncbi:MAG TPA: plastocyanin/azurin family copper-binding protein [Flavobacteriales bacterium]|nr:plastocyanin/azurin family copper-binding protein [Flavobacteriales bacterium]